MRPSIPRLVRVIPRSQLSKEHAVKPLPEPVRHDVKRPTLIQILMERKAKAGDSYPPNIRIEPFLTKGTFKDVSPEVKRELRELVRER